jgi:hypothetical protein
MTISPANKRAGSSICQSCVPKLAPPNAGFLCSSACSTTTQCGGWPCCEHLLTILDCAPMHIWSKIVDRLQGRPGNAPHGTQAATQPALSSQGGTHWVAATWQPPRLLLKRRPRPPLQGQGCLPAYATVEPKTACLERGVPRLPCAAAYGGCIPTCETSGGCRGVLASAKSDPPQLHT